jgi:type II secretory ATPase GspE/PulE/Tfp pilus assembly ATPase PilB-like protein
MDVNKPIIIKTVNRLLHQAIEEEVSSIHCEFSRESGLSVAWKRHEQLTPVAVFVEPMAEDVKDYLHALLKWPRGKILDPKTISITTDLGKISLQAWGLATKDGEKIVLTLKEAGGDLIPLDSLGFNNEHLALLKPAIATSGLVIITGPSGSGKTTTAYAILSALNANKANVYSIEETPAHNLPGINQLVCPKGLDWPMLFRTLDKQDADIIYLDINESIPPANELTLLATKKLVIINLDASSISDCLAKLDLGAGVSKINLIINQVLARQLCPHCGFSYKLDQATFNELVKDFGILDQDLIGLDLYHNAGCATCNHSGYLGHVGLFEMLAPSPELKQLLANNLSASTKTKINEEIALSILEDGFIKAFQGLITAEELKKKAVSF